MKCARPHLDGTGSAVWSSSADGGECQAGEYGSDIAYKKEVWGSQGPCVRASLAGYTPLPNHQDENLRDLH